MHSCNACGDVGELWVYGAPSQRLLPLQIFLALELKSVQLHSLIFFVVRSGTV